MNERKDTKWGGAEVENQKTKPQEMHDEQGTIRETVSASGPEHREQGRLSTADLAGEREGAAVAARSSRVAAPMGQQEQKPEAQTPLFPETEGQGFRNRWQELQASFVDDPRNTVQQADALVAEVMQRLAQTFSEERKKLEGQWERGGDVSTEDLRVALQRYRSFFGRLLAV